MVRIFSKPLSWIATERPFIEWTRRTIAPEGLWQSLRERLAKALGRTHLG